MQKEDKMKRKLLWLIGTLVVVATVGTVLAWTQTTRLENATIQDLYDLLVTADGRNRLDILEEKLDDIDAEVDLIHSVAERMLDDQYGFFQRSDWTLDDVKYALQRIEHTLSTCLKCP
jgi:hypothetical protein